MHISKMVILLPALLISQTIAQDYTAWAYTYLCYDCGCDADTEAGLYNNAS
jgi:hypothetical protein